MRVSIHQPHYLLWLPYLSKIVHSDAFVLLDDVEFTRNGYQNRNRIKTAQGPLTLTVPVQQKLGQTIADTLVSQDGWRKKHWSSIQQAYRKAPYFARYEAELAEFFGQPWEGLADPLCAMTGWLIRILNLAIPISRSSRLEVASSSSQRLVDIVKAVGGSSYLSGAFALQAYLDPEVFQKAAMPLFLFDWKCPEYQQLHAPVGFVPNLAALDCLLNLGPEATVQLVRAGGSRREH